MGRIKIFFVGLICLILAGCSNKKNEISLLLDWDINTNHTGFVVAMELGYYEDEGLSLRMFSLEDNVLPLVATGKAQFGVSTQEEVGMAIDNQDLAITAVATLLQHNTSGILSFKDENIQSFKDLEFKTYATWGLPLEQAILKQVMEDDGADFSNLDLYYSTVTDTFSALSTSVDAVWVYEGWDVSKARLLGVDFNFIKFSDFSPYLDFYTPLLVVNDEFMKNSSEVVIKFLRATKKGYEFTAENPEKAAEILCEKFPEVDFNLALESQKFIADELLDETGNWGYIDPKRWNRFFNWAFEKNIFSSSLENLGFTNWFLDKIK